MLKLLILICCLQLARGWDSEQLEVFDVVEEVKQNFYDLLNISKDASNSEVKSAFRALSLKLHPDKNKDVDTSEQFRNLVSVYEVLRSTTKRKYYDEVLINGMPNWRSGLFYYRYVRKMGMTEVVIILFVITTIGQYLVNWGAYLEKKMTLQEQIKKKKVKKSRIAEESAIPEIVLPKPSITDTLPVQIPRFTWQVITSLPWAFLKIKSIIHERLEEINREKQPIPEPEPAPVPVKTVRKRNKFVVPEGPNFEVQHSTDSADNVPEKSAAPTISGGLWTDDDLTELIRLVKKFPQGSSRRWESIADALGRSVAEVTYMSNKMKENGYRLPGSEQAEEVPQVKVKQKTKKELDLSDNVKKWSQEQQRCLEDALAKYPKKSGDRWERIAEHVPNKTKEECMMRFRYLAENLKKQKEKEEVNCDNSDKI